jgi:hypothetical protein
MGSPYGVLQFRQQRHGAALLQLLQEEELKGES